MIHFRPLSPMERLLRLWPPYRRRMDDEMREAIQRLMADPSLACKVGDIVIPNGYGVADGRDPWG